MNGFVRILVAVVATAVLAAPSATAAGPADGFAYRQVTVPNQRYDSATGLGYSVLGDGQRLQVDGSSLYRHGEDAWVSNMFTFLPEYYFMSAYSRYFVLSIPGVDSYVHCAAGPDVYSRVKIDGSSDAAGTSSADGVVDCYDLSASGKYLVDFPPYIKDGGRRGGTAPCIQVQHSAGSSPEWVVEAAASCHADVYGPDSKGKRTYRGRFPVPMRFELDAL